MPNIQNELITETLRLSPREGMYRTSIANLQIARSNSPTGPVPTVYTPALCFIVQGEKDAIIGTNVFRYTAQQYLVASVPLPVSGQVVEASAKKPYLCLVLDIDAKIIYDVMKSADMLNLSKPMAAPGVYRDKVYPDLSDAFLRLLRTCESEADRNVLGPMITREITYRLLKSKYGNVLSQLAITGSQSQRINKVISQIRKDFARKYTTEELGKIAGMSTSNFHHQFKLVTSLSPLQYQKNIRLQEARKLPLAEIGDIATVAMQVGYESSTQFTREYARLFGLPPGRDLKKLRETV